MADDIALRVSGVKKEFKLPHEKNTSIKGAVVNFYKKKGFERQRVLKGIDFEVKKGEFFGIVGRNGSGKSTLLKLLAGIYAPNAGAIEVNGALTPFIELGVGFNMELTGRENVFLNGALLGFSRKEMAAMYDDIVTFAGLERFMDQKLKNYSSGMQVRLAFSIAIRAKSDILLIDEVLAVGDASFQQKCFEVFAELKKQGTTIILVTHDMSSVLRFCDRAILIDSGEIVKSGKPSDVADLYLELNYENNEAQRKDEAVTTIDASQPRITKVALHAVDGRGKKTFSANEEIEIVIDFSNPKVADVHFGVQVFNASDVYCFGTNTKVDAQPTVNAKKGTVSLRLVPMLTSETYTVNVALMNENASIVLDYKPRVSSFRVAKDSQIEGVVLLEHSWKL